MGVVLGPPCVQSGSYRTRVDLTHELADVLRLAPAPLEIRNALRFQHGRAQYFRKLDGGELFATQGNELDTQLLQPEHFLLALGLAYRRVPCHHSNCQRKSGMPLKW